MKARTISIVLLTLLASCTPTATHAPVATRPAATETGVPTKAYTSTAASIPTLAATRTPVPTFTPAAPDEGHSYRLREWTAEQADLLINQISSYLGAIANEQIFDGVYGRSYYMKQFRYLAFAEQEALLRFPNAVQAENWQWDLCYNLALSYPYAESADAPELGCYANLIEDGLNSGQTDPAGLPDWFKAHESRYSIEVTPHTSPRGYTSSYVISLEASAILILLEKSDRFQVKGLISSMFFFRESGVHFEQLDFTGDGYPELVLNFGRSHCCGAFTQQFVYELSSGEPQVLAFKNLSGTFTHTTSDYDSYITPLESEPPGLLFKGHYGYELIPQLCSVWKYDRYSWNGHEFELSKTWFGIDEPGEYDDREFCQFVIDTAREQGELDVAVKTIGDHRFDEPNITKDQILYRLGEHHARLGNVEKAREFFTGVIAIQAGANPSDSEWARAAQAFLDNYQKKSDYYGVCSKVTPCNMHDALQQLIADMESDPFLVASERLKAAGVPVRSDGFVNFDGGERIEQWLVVQHPGRAAREFWILVQGPGEIDGLFVADISANRPELREFQGSNTYGLIASEGETLFSLETFDFSGQPYVLTHGIVKDNDPLMEADYLESYLVDEPLDDLINRLFRGDDPAEIRDLLLQFNQSKSFDCKRAGRCDQVAYLLGLTDELLGEEQSALNAYLQLWNEYPDSPYTIMARAKLELTP